MFGWSSVQRVSAWLVTWPSRGPSWSPPHAEGQQGELCWGPLSAGHRLPTSRWVRSAPRRGPWEGGPRVGGGAGAGGWALGGLVQG